MIKQITPQLDLSSVNFDNVDEINSFAAVLISAANSLEILDSALPPQSAEALAIYDMAKRWVNTVGSKLTTMSPSDALAVVDAYEVMYKIAFRHDAPAEKLNIIKLTAFDAVIHGDKEVDEYIMFRTIRKAVRRRQKAFLGKPLAWTCTCEDRWYREAIAGFDTTRLTDYDIISRVSLLLDSDLYAYEGHRQQQFKQRLFNQYRHYLTSHATSR